MIRYALILLLCTHSLESAAPVVHAYCAEMYFTYCRPNYSLKQREAFMRGTLFPDIRYIASISRTETHTKNVTLEEVTSSKNPFTAGMLFHSYIDEQREALAQQVGIYDHLTNIPKRHKAALLKIIEDQLIYAKLNVPMVRKALRTFSAEERQHKVKIPTIMLWHRLLTNYLKQSPDSFFHKKVANRQGYLLLPADAIANAYTIIKQYSADKKVQTYAETLIHTIEEGLKKR